MGKIAAWRRRLIDHPQSARLCRKQCEINRYTLIRLRIFQTNLPMHDAGASQLRMRGTNRPVSMRRDRDGEEKKRGLNS
jgi:hypothetical protein